MNQEAPLLVAGRKSPPQLPYCRATAPHINPYNHHKITIVIVGVSTISAVQINFDYENEVRNVIETHDLKESPAEFVRKAGLQRMDRLRDGDLDAR